MKSKMMTNKEQYFSNLLRFSLVNYQSQTITDQDKSTFDSGLRATKGANVVVGRVSKPETTG